jgi:hypothetical protein
MKLLLQSGNRFRTEQRQRLTMVAVAFRRTESLAGDRHTLVRSVLKRRIIHIKRRIKWYAPARAKDEKSLRKNQSCSKMGSGRSWAIEHSLRFYWKN